jgi:hypothetical protein
MGIPEEKRESLEAIKAMNKARPRWRYDLSEEERCRKRLAFGGKIVELLWGSVDDFLNALRDAYRGDGPSVGGACKYRDVGHVAEYLSLSACNLWPHIWYAVAVKDFGDDRIFRLPMPVVVTCIRDRHPDSWKRLLQELLDQHVQAKKPKISMKELSAPRKAQKSADAQAVEQRIQSLLSAGLLKKIEQLKKERRAVVNDTPRLWRVITQMGELFIQAVDGSVEQYLKRREERLPSSGVSQLLQHVGSLVGMQTIYYCMLITSVTHVCKEALEAVKYQYPVFKVKSTMEKLLPSQWRAAIAEVLPLAPVEIVATKPSVVPRTPMTASPSSTLYKITVTVKEKDLALYLMSFCMDDARYQVHMTQMYRANMCSTTPTPVEQPRKNGWQNEFVTVLSVSHETWEKLKEAGIHYLGELVAYPPTTLKGVTEMEDTQVTEIETLLKSQNLYLGMPESEIPGIRQKLGRVPCNG